jgi:hypothetical protein
MKYRHRKLQGELRSKSQVYCNGFDESITRQQFGKHVPTHAHATVEEAVFSTWSVRSLYNKDLL